MGDFRAGTATFPEGIWGHNEAGVVYKDRIAMVNNIMIIAKISPYNPFSGDVSIKHVGYN